MLEKQRLEQQESALAFARIGELDAEQFSGRMARLYGDLDHLHPFKEGNSRTLRAFTGQLAREAGYELTWNTTNAGVDWRQAEDTAMAKSLGTDLQPAEEVYQAIAQASPAAITEWQRSALRDRVNHRAQGLAAAPHPAADAGPSPAP